MGELLAYIKLFTICLVVCQNRNTLPEQASNDLVQVAAGTWYLKHICKFIKEEPNGTNTNT